MILQHVDMSSKEGRMSSKEGRVKVVWSFCYVIKRNLNITG